eukprot:218833-Prymnesium_polylepis.2
MSNNVRQCPTMSDNVRQCPTSDIPKMPDKSEDGIWHNGQTHRKSSVSCCPATWGLPGGSRAPLPA